jgi:hypothetical protein
MDASLVRLFWMYACACMLTLEIAIAPKYRLSPQYPFPCALQDLLASCACHASEPCHIWLTYLLQTCSSSSLHQKPRTAPSNPATSLSEATRPAAVWPSPSCKPSVTLVYLHPLAACSFPLGAICTIHSRASSSIPTRYDTHSPISSCRLSARGAGHRPRDGTYDIQAKPALAASTRRR